MSFSDLSHRLDAEVMHHLGDGPCDYQGSISASGIAYLLEEGWEIYDENRPDLRVTTISVLVRDVARSRQGDKIVTPHRTWSVEHILSDDGHWRRLWVS